MSNFAAGCDDGESEPGPITIAITADKAPALVAFRDGLDGEWQAAAMKTPTTFEAEVHGPYVITIACEDLAIGNFMTRQVARTPDDEHSVTVKCDSTPPTTHAITGHMMQAGRVQLGGESDASTTADWDFSIDVSNGTYDLMARTDDRIVLRRAIKVTGDVALTPAIDATQEGTALADVAFTVTNAAPAEVLTAVVDLDQPEPMLPFDVYRGPIAAAKVVPESALTTTDTQRATIQAVAGNQLRELRRSFRVGGKTAYTLPAPLAGLKWEQTGDTLAVSWTSAPEFDSFTVTMDGASADGTKLQSYALELSPSFAAASGATRATVDTAIAGYKPEWKIDRARQYSRGLVVERSSNGEIATNEVSETIMP
jgi:hypothetical protein